MDDIQNAQLVVHRDLDKRYHVSYERVGTAKGTLGFKVVSNGDDLIGTLTDANELLRGAFKHAEIFSANVTEKGGKTDGDKNASQGNTVAQDNIS